MQETIWRVWRVHPFLIRTNSCSQVRSPIQEQVHRNASLPPFTRTPVFLQQILTLQWSQACAENRPYTMRNDIAIDHIIEWGTLSLLLGHHRSFQKAGKPASPMMKNLSTNDCQVAMKLLSLNWGLTNFFLGNLTSLYCFSWSRTTLPDFDLDCQLWHHHTCTFRVKFSSNFFFFEWSKLIPVLMTDSVSFRKLQRHIPCDRSEGWLVG